MTVTGASEQGSARLYVLDHGSSGGYEAAVTVTGTDDPDLVLGSDGGESLFGLGGADILNGGHGRDTLTGGSGADRFVFDADALADAGVGIRDLIADYNFGEGDIIDLSALLGAQSINDANAAGYVRMDGGFLKVDIDGASGPAGFVVIAEFATVPAAPTLRILTDDDPGGSPVYI